MTVGELKRLLATKPHFIPQDEFDSLEIIILVDGFEFFELSDLLGVNGVQEFETTDSYALVFGLTTKNDDPDDILPLDHLYNSQDQIYEPDVKDELAFLGKRNNPN